MQSTLMYYVTALLVLFLSNCGGPEIPPDLERAKDVFSRFLAPMNLQNSMFAAAYPECKPSQFVRYIFSSLGAAELPMGESMATDSDREESESIGMPLWPKDVAMTALAPDPKRGKQLVLKHNDAKNMLIIEAYVNPKKPPVATYEWQIEKVVPSEMARLAFQSNFEMGAGY